MKRFNWALSLVFLSALSAPQATFAQGKQLVALGAGPQQGTFYAVLSSYGKLMKDELGWNANVEVTGGPTNNVQLAHGGQIEFGISTMAPIYEGYTGTGWTKGKEHDNIRSVLGTFSSRFYFYTFSDRGIAKAADVAGKRVSAGSTGSTPALFSKRVFEVLGGAPSAYITGGFADLNNQLRDGLVDAGFIVSGLPHPAVTELSVRREMTVFSFDEAERKKIQESYPYLKDCVIPADTYKGQTKDVDSLCLWNAIITHKDVSEEMVYNLTKTVLENLPTLVQAHKSATQTSAENVAVLAIPLHKGAARYYAEKGLAIPDAAKPVD
jgi:TRAP transporter TAXI family solute receptor